MGVVGGGGGVVGAEAAVSTETEAAVRAAVERYDGVRRSAYDELNAIFDRAMARPSRPWRRRNCLTRRERRRVGVLMARIRRCRDLVHHLVGIVG